MSISILVLIVLAQILFVFFFIVTTVVFQESFGIFEVPVYLLLVIALNILSLFLLGSMYQKEAKQKVKSTETTHEEQFHALVASVRSDRHDLNNHLTVLFGLLSIKNYESATNYIKEMIGDIKISNQALTINNPVLASMLFSKMDQYQREGIAFTLRKDTEELTKMLSSTDLIRLISNLLDNAYDATTQMPEDQRKITLEILDYGGKFSIISKNTTNLTEFNPNFLEVGYSTKATVGTRGYGLSIIQKIIKKYNGLLFISIEGGLISFKIEFPKGASYD